MSEDTNFNEESSNQNGSDLGKNKNKVHKNVDFDTVLSNISSGTSCFSILYFVIIIAGMLSGCFIFYSINYFTIDPVYTCIPVGK